MRRHVAMLNILLALALTCAPVAALAQQSAVAGEWSAVQAVAQGTELIIKLKSGETVRGKVTSVTETTLSITGKKNRTETVDKSSVLEVYEVRRKSEKTKYALIGAGVGAGVGAGIGAAKNSPNIDDGEIYTMVGIPLGAGIGALAGFLFGKGRQKRVLIYQAR